MGIRECLLRSLHSFVLLFLRGVGTLSNAQDLPLALTTGITFVLVR